MSNDPPKEIALVKSVFGWALWNNKEFELNQVSAVYVLKEEVEIVCAENERLDKACCEWAEVSQANYQRAKTAEAKLAKAVEALEWQAGQLEAHPFMVLKARTALAQLRDNQ